MQIELLGGSDVFQHAGIFYIFYFFNYIFRFPPKI